MVTPDAMVSVTPELTVHVSPVPIVASELIVVSLLKVIEAASAGCTGMNRNETNTKAAIIADNPATGMMPLRSLVEFITLLTLGSNNKVVQYTV
jgi:hypothetical protein